MTYINPLQIAQDAAAKLIDGDRAKGLPPLPILSFDRQVAAQQMALFCANQNTKLRSSIYTADVGMATFVMCLCAAHPAIFHLDMAKEITLPSSKPKTLAHFARDFSLAAKPDPEIVTNNLSRCLQSATAAFLRATTGEAHPHLMRIINPVGEQKAPRDDVESALTDLVMQTLVVGNAIPHYWQNNMDAMFKMELVEFRVKMSLAPGR